MLISLLSGEISENDYYYINNIKILYRKLPKKVYGFIFRYKSENIITVNNCISLNKQKKTILHELAHLELYHLDNNKNLMEFKIESIEDEADKYIQFILENIKKY